MGGKKLSLFIDEASQHLAIFLGFMPPKLLGKTDLKESRLAYFSDKEGKTRVVAIVDYLSQTVLKNLHLYLFKVLKKIPQDCTFDQGSFIEKIKDWDYYCSVDLSSATDRFPISLIAGVLKGHLPSFYVDAWETVMVDRLFTFKGKSKEYAVMYSVGNPMGAYSS